MDERDPYFDPLLPAYSSPPQSSTEGTPDDSVASGASSRDIDSTSSGYDSGPEQDDNLHPDNGRDDYDPVSSRDPSRVGTPPPPTAPYHHHVHVHYHNSAPRLTPSALEDGTGNPFDALDAHHHTSTASSLFQRAGLLSRANSTNDIGSDGGYASDHISRHQYTSRKRGQGQGSGGSHASGTSTPGRWFSPNGSVAGDSPKRKKRHGGSGSGELPFSLPLSAPMSAASSTSGYTAPRSGLGLTGPIALGTPKLRRNRLLCLPAFIFRCIGRILQHPLVPTRPITIIFACLLFTSFAASLTTFLKYVLNPDKEPLPWRTYCQEQPAFPHALADKLEPVTIFVGVFSMDAAYDRRAMIRNTYARHSKPIDERTGRPTLGIQVKFVLGRPRREHARRVALEMEMYNDMVLLDIPENMNRGKTHAYFTWASENATIPFYYQPTSPRAGALETGEVALGFKKADFVVKADDDSFIVLSELERHLRVAPREMTYWGYLVRNLFMAGESYALSSDLVQYVASDPRLLAHTVGAEDKITAKWMRMHPNASSINWVWDRCWIYDHPKAGTVYSHGFLFPDEVERVRAEGRTGISEEERERRGGDWAGSYSTVTKWKQTYVRPVGPYGPPQTMEEEVEALIEGGGRWNGTWLRPATPSVPYSDVVFEAADRRIASEPLWRKGGKADGRYEAPEQPTYDADMGTATRYTKLPSDLLRDPGTLPPGVLERLKAQAADLAKGGKRERDVVGREQVLLGHEQPSESAVEATSASSSLFDYSPSSSLVDYSPSSSSVDYSPSSSSFDHASSSSAVLQAPSSSVVPQSSSSSYDFYGSSSSLPPVPLASSQPAIAQPNGPSSGYARPLPKQNLAEMPNWASIAPEAAASPVSEGTQVYPGLPSLPRYITPPELRYDPEDVAVRQRRMLGRPHGGTVIIHFLKRNEWFQETALALLGRSAMWDEGWSWQQGPLATGSGISGGGSGDFDAKSAVTPSRVGAANSPGGVERVEDRWGGGRMYGSPAIDREGRITYGSVIRTEGKQGSEVEAIDTRVRPEEEAWRGMTRPPNRMAFAEPTGPSGVGEMELTKEEVEAQLQLAQKGDKSTSKPARIKPKRQSDSAVER